MTATIEIVQQYITEHLLQQRNISLTDTEQLIQNGYLSSLAVVELVVFLEERFGIEIDPDDVTEEHFATLQSIAGLVERQRRVQGVS